jgi:hypothetical protein
MENTEERQFVGRCSQTFGASHCDGSFASTHFASNAVDTCGAGEMAVRGSKLLAAAPHRLEQPVVPGATLWRAVIRRNLRTRLQCVRRCADGGAGQFA